MVALFLYIQLYVKHKLICFYDFDNIDTMESTYCMVSSELTKFLKQQHILNLIDDENFTEVYKLCTSNREIISELTRFLLDCDIKPDNYMSTIPALYLYDSPGITKYDISDSVTSIGRNAFKHCTGLTSITIPNSITSIGYCAFDGCTSLTSITIPDSVTSIGSFAFTDCTSLTSVTIGNSVTSIELEAFGNCSSLTSITIPNSVTSIETSVFSCCSSLTSITIPDSVTSIKENAFSACTKLKSIDIPVSVTSIDSSAFYGCQRLNINFNGTKVQWRQLASGNFKACTYTCTCLDGVVKNSL